MDQKKREMTPNVIITERISKEVQQALVRDQELLQSENLVDLFVHILDKSSRNDLVTLLEDSPSRTRLESNWVEILEVFHMLQRMTLQMEDDLEEDSCERSSNIRINYSSKRRKRKDRI